MSGEQFERIESLYDNAEKAIKEASVEAEKAGSPDLMYAFNRLLRPIWDFQETLRQFKPKKP